MHAVQKTPPRGAPSPTAQMRRRSALALRAALALAGAMVMTGALVLLALEQLMGADALDAPTAAPSPAEPVAAAACDRWADGNGAWT